MKKKLILIVAIPAVLIFGFFVIFFGSAFIAGVSEASQETQTTALSCNHQWQRITCLAPIECVICGKVDDETPVVFDEHIWKDATCFSPKKCTRCTATEGSPLEHNWLDATCTNPKKCEHCGRSDGEKLEHNYEKNVCTMCADVLIEDYWELQSYLCDNFETLETSVGSIDGLDIVVTSLDKNWDTHDFDVVIDSSLYFDDLNASLDRIVFDGDFLDYDVRIQAVVDVLKYQEKIVKICEDAFPDQKFEVKFKIGGYEYPNLGVGYVSYEYFTWRNWEYNNSGKSGYLGTDKVDFTIDCKDFLDLDFYILKDYPQILQIMNDVQKGFPGYKISHIIYSLSSYF